MKRFFFASLVAIMLVSLAGCGNNTPSNDISESPAMQEEQNNVPKSSESENSEPIKESSPQDTAEPQGTTDALDNAVEKDVADTIASLNSEYEKLVTGIDTFDKYVNNTEKVEGFYTKIYEETQALCIRLCEYSINYAEVILASGQTNDDKYDALDTMYDNIYDDAFDEVYDEIYDSIFDDLYDSFYDGIIEDAYDTVPYEDWSDAHSDEYGIWSDTRSDVYEEWSDCRSDIYGFWSDIRSELYGDDIEGAEKKLDKFKSKVEKTKNKAASDNSLDQENASAEVVPSDTLETTTSTNDPTDGIRPEFKETMDTYEAFFDEYADFMERYAALDSDDTAGMLTMLSEYTDYMTRYAEAMEALDDISEQDLSKEELLYYTEVMGRINQKLISVAY